MNISLEIDKQENASIYIFDMLGKICQKSDFFVHTGKNDLQTSVADLPQGMYILQVKLGEKLYGKRFVVK